MQANLFPVRLRIQLLLSGIVLALLWLLGLLAQLEVKSGIPALLIASGGLLIVIGSIIHLPLCYADAVQARPPAMLYGLLWPERQPVYGKVLIAVNLGGALLPLGYALAMFWAFRPALLPLLGATVICSTTAYLLSRPIRGFGIAIPLVLVPMIGAVSAKTLLPEHAMIAAYISVTIGVILGADLFRLRDLKQLGSSFVSIGGAGLFDGIVQSGILASLFILLL